MSLKRRLLARRERTACQVHSCDVCEMPIFPGDYYEVSVEVRKNGSYSWLWVRKEHINPGCHFPPDEEGSDFDSNVIPFPIQLPFAA